MDRGSAGFSRDLAQGGARLPGAFRPGRLQSGQGYRDRADDTGGEYLRAIEVPWNSNAGLFRIPAAVPGDLQLESIVSREIRVAAADRLGLEPASAAVSIPRVGLSDRFAGHA